MVLSTGYVTLRHCGVEAELAGLGAVPCSLLVGHEGRHYWGMQFPDLHIAVGWESAPVHDPVPNSRDVENGDAPLRVLPVSVGTHKMGAGS